LDPYRRESLKILAIFKELVPKGEIGKSSALPWSLVAFWSQIAEHAEKASIDEAFLDLTLMVIDRLIAIHPYLAAPPPDAPEGLDSPLPRPPPIDWTKAGNLFPVNGEEGEAGGGDETEPGEGEGHMYSSQRSDEDGNGPGGREGDGSRKLDRGITWEDWALCIGAEIMAEVRAEVWKRLHYTCSAVSLWVYHRRM
jgi:DNA polymerase eta